MEDQKGFYHPSKTLVENSNVKKLMDKYGMKDVKELYARAEDQEWYWGEMGKEVVDWYKPWDKVLDWKLPFSKWFVGGKFNIVHNALDRHVNGPLRHKVAYVWEGEPGEVEKWTYYDLYREVNKLANAMKKMGVKKGDRVTIYLPMVPQLAVAMLACAKIGAVHSVVFSGFSASSMRDRIQDSESVMVITADGGYRRGKTVALKHNADESMVGCPSVKNVIVLKRTKQDVKMMEGRDHWWHEVTARESEECPTEVMDSEDMLYLLYTSGTTGKPKGIVHIQGGYAVGTATTLKYVFDIKETDVWWCAADVGWVTGHSYIVYAPLILGATSILYEGAPDYPDAGRWWRTIERERVTILYTSPTAIRMHMRYGQEWAEKSDLSSLRLLGSVGEPINPEAWRWYFKHIGKDKCPIMDTWWQTETGNFVISPLPVTPLKPGSATRPLPGFGAAVFTPDGKPIKPNENGFGILTKPWPAMLRTLYKDPERYKEVYWSRYPNFYLTGDSATIDEDGYFWFRGRADEVLNVAGHRLGTAEVESALVSHAAVAEAAVIGIPHEVKGDVPKAHVVLKVGFTASEQLEKELKEWVSKEIGPIARPEWIEFRDKLPKTRSGKIMRRLLKAEALGKPIGDISTLEE